MLSATVTLKIGKLGAMVSVLVTVGVPDAEMATGTLVEVNVCGEPLAVIDGHTVLSPRYTPPEAEHEDGDMTAQVVEVRQHAPVAVATALVVLYATSAKS
jgi:hypothetical protein